MSDDIFIYPTDTVWGIGGNIHSEKMAERVNLIKGYSEAKPLSILFYDFNMLSDYFQLELFDMDWLKELFKKEATLGLPVSWLKKEIPKESHGDSPFVCVRVLSLPFIKELIESAGGPVYTTSFNYRNDPPMTTLSEVSEKKKELCPDAILLGDNTSLSGSSSTIFVIDEQGAFKILRPGTRAEEIEEHIKLFTA